MDIRHGYVFLFFFLHVICMVPYNIDKQGTRIWVHPLRLLLYGTYLETRSAKQVVVQVYTFVRLVFVFSLKCFPTQRTACNLGRVVHVDRFGMT